MDKLILFHGTTPSAGNKIAKNGLRPGEDGCIWLTADFHTAEMYASGALVELSIEKKDFDNFGCKFVGEDSLLGFKHKNVFSCCKWDNTKSEIQVWHPGKHYRDGEKQEFNLGHGLSSELKDVLAELISEIYVEMEADKRAGERPYDPIENLLDDTIDEKERYTRWQNSKVKNV